MEAEVRIEKPSISDLHGDTATEHRFGALAYELMQGRDVYASACKRVFGG